MYQIIYTQQASNDLILIYHHLINVTQQRDIAKDQVEKIRFAISTLNELPQRCPIYPLSISKNIRRMLVNRYIVFFSTENKAIIILRIMSQGQKLDVQLTKV